MDEHSLLVRTGPAVTGHAAPRVPQWSVTVIAKAFVTMRLPAHGIHRILRADRMADAVTPISAALAVTACSTASPLTSVVQNGAAEPLG